MKKRTEPLRMTDVVRPAFARVCVGLSLLWFILVVSPVLVAQPARLGPPATARDDRAPLRVRYPAAEHLRDLQTDRDYQYGRDTPPPDNPIARFFSWLFQKISEFFRSEAYENVWQYVMLVAIAAGVIYLLAKAEVLGFLFPKKARVSDVEYENLTEDIQVIDFDTAIDEAATARNFRLAVRLLYLQTLKHLTNAGRITYKPDKTNRQYVQELTNSGLQPDFGKLTRQFEFVWYGDFPVDEHQFATIRDEFRQFSTRAASLRSAYSTANQL